MRDHTPLPPKLTTGDGPGTVRIRLDRRLHGGLFTPLAPPVSQVVERITVTMDQRIDVIRRALLAGLSVSFQSLLRDCRSRIEIVITFLALLELMKAGDVVVRQDAPFGEIIVELHA